MKAIFISYNQALSDRVVDVLNRLEIRGFTKWALTEGRGSVDGEPHYGTHAWPSMNSSMMIFLEDQKCVELLNELREMDESAPTQGVRTFTWTVD